MIIADSLIEICCAYVEGQLACDQIHLWADAREQRRAKRSGGKESGEDWGSKKVTFLSRGFAPRFRGVRACALTQVFLQAKGQTPYGKFFLRLRHFSVFKMSLRVLLMWLYSPWEDSTF